MKELFENACWFVLLTILITTIMVSGSWLGPRLFGDTSGNKSSTHTHSIPLQPNELEEIRQLHNRVEKLEKQVDTLNKLYNVASCDSKRGKNDTQRDD